MRYTLKDYQAEAVRGVLTNLERARHSYHQWDVGSQFSLSATTGAGKTVMAASVIESLFFGNDELDFPADPGAVVLWFSDDPSLNEQSRIRLQAAASELDSRLVIVETDFVEPIFRPGHVYFLNTQKLSRNSRLVRGEPDEINGQTRLFRSRPDMAQTSIYDTIRNTIADENLTLYFILDEAHRGMRGSTKARDTIVQQLINGTGATPPMPIVFGISATVERFETAMKDAKNRVALPSVVVDSALVQASGLLKDDIVLTIPAEEGNFETVLLREAVNRVRRSTTAWEKYCEEQSETEPVIPLLVVQVGDKPSQETLTRTLHTIYESWPELGSDAVANVFGEHTDLEIAGYVVPYIEPQRVQDARHVRVLLAKSAISTGWDCPRAEVLVSFRPAKDRTHITQLLGRMIRTPLARRVPGNELLNSVDCLLPYFDRGTALDVADMLMQGATSKDAADGSDAGGGEGRRVLFDPVTLYPNRDIASAVWPKFESLPTVSIPRADSKPIPRLTKFAAALSRDGLVEGALKRAHNHLHRVLTSRKDQYKEEVAAAKDDVINMRTENIRSRLTGGITHTTLTLRSDHRAVEEYYRGAKRILSPDVAETYVRYITGPEDGEDDIIDAYIQLAALTRIPQVVADVEAEAERLTNTWLTQTRVARKGLTDERKATYDQIIASSSVPERQNLEAPQLAQVDTKVRLADGTEQDLPTATMHLMATEDGDYPLDLGGWEERVLQTEMARPNFLGWYRNPSRAAKESLAIAYQDDGGAWRALRPDFLFFSRNADGSIAVDVVDPHGYHLADAVPKLKGLAHFAETYGNEFRRIESIADIKDQLRVLDVTRPDVRQAIRSATGARALYESDLADDYL